jgi:BASS family bile acid:Na+ symporter
MRDLARSGFAVALVAFVFTTMLAAGLNASRPAVTGILRSRRGRATVGLVLGANLVVVPMVGVAVVNVFSLPDTGAIGLLLLASSPGAPFAVKLLLLHHGDVSIGATLQLVLAVVGTVTFAATADRVLASVDLGADVRLPVLPLMATVIVLQLTPFVVGVRIRERSSGIAHGWLRPISTASTVTFAIAVFFALLASGPEIVALSPSILIGTAVFAALSAAVGGLVSVGGPTTRAATATLAPMRATGPPFAAIAVVYGSDPSVLGAITGEIIVILGVGVLASFVASWGAGVSVARTSPPNAASA